MEQAKTEVLPGADPQGRKSHGVKAARTVGIDLALTGPHVVVVGDMYAQQQGNAFKVEDTPEELEKMWARCRQGLSAEEKVQWVMEPTSHAWVRMTGFLRSKGEELIFTPSSRKFSPLRKMLSIGVKNDALDARALMKVPAVAGEVLKPLVLPSAPLLALKRVTKMYEQATLDIVRYKSRLHSLMGLLNPGVMGLLVRDGEFTELARRFIREVWTPTRVKSAEWLKKVLRPRAGQMAEEQFQQLLERCRQNAEYINRAQAQGTLPVEMETVRIEANFLLDALESAERRRQPLEKQRDHWVNVLDPGGELRSITGIANQLAGVILAYTGPIERFRNLRSYKGFVGLVPGSVQSGGNKEPKGRQITRAGPNALKTAYYLAAQSAMFWDPQLASFACRLQDRGLTYAQVVVAVANKVIARVYAVLERCQKRDQVQNQSVAKAVNCGYELRTPEGQPISKPEAKHLVDTRYRIKSKKNPNPSRELDAPREETKTSPECTRQSLVPQLETVTEDPCPAPPREFDAPREEIKTSPDCATVIVYPVADFLCPREEIKTSPDCARQSLAPQPETVPKDKWEYIIAHSPCTERTKQALHDNRDVLEQGQAQSLERLLTSPAPDETLVLMQLKLLIFRAERFKSEGQAEASP